MTCSVSFQPFSVTIPLIPRVAMYSRVRPLAIGCQISTGRLTGRGTQVTSFRSYPRYGTAGGIV